jgi:thiamine-monophosphate kinase
MIDEDQFLAAFLPTLPGANDLIVPPGDDCAAVACPGDPTRAILLAVDQVAAGVHYYDRTAPEPTAPELAGRKLIARNLSDIAAMGGRPDYALLSLAEPETTPADWLHAFAGGVAEGAAEYGVAVIGGDLSRAGASVASLTIVGHADRNRLCRRAAARDGDVIAVTGALGLSFPSGRHLNFVPRLDEGAWLAEHGVRAMMDLSDGLCQDLSRMCRAAELAAEIEPDAIPLARWQGRVAAVAEALADGEDYELLVALPAEFAEALCREWPFAVPLSIIGRFTRATPERPLLASPGGTDLRSLCEVGFRHF